MCTLKVCEIFASIQGESTYQGLPCIFIRLSGCNLRCSYCDTAYSYDIGKDMVLEEIVNTVKNFEIQLVEITGGEPLLQPGSILLMEKLLELGYKVLLETNGSLSIKNVPQAVIKIMDIKLFSSGMHAHNDYENINYLTEKDEIKFVISDKKDYDEAVRIISAYGLNGKMKLLFSPAEPGIKMHELAEFILKDKLPVRLNLQLHKILWNNQRGR